MKLLILAFIYSVLFGCSNPVYDVDESVTLSDYIAVSTPLCCDRYKFVVYQPQIERQKYEFLLSSVMTKGVIDWDTSLATKNPHLVITINHRSQILILTNENLDSIIILFKKTGLDFPDSISASIRSNMYKANPSRQQRPEADLKQSELHK